MGVSESTMAGSMVETVACKVDDMKDGEMRQIDIGDGGHALLVRENGAYTAVGYKCTHYGAPLIKGSLMNGRVRCPWHGACFNTTTGDIEDFPGLDSIPKFETQIVDGNVIVRANPEDLKSHKKVAKMCQPSPGEDARTFLLIGGGPSSLECAETLRKNNFKGKIVIATTEDVLPYDRPMLSKMLQKKGSEIALRSKEFLDKYCIEVELEKEASKLDAEKKEVTYEDGSTMKYDKLFIGTGGTPRVMDAPGGDLQNVCYLRSPNNANAIAAACKDKKLVVIGTSFIGLEVAAFGIGKGGATSVDVIGQSPTPFAKVFGPEIGARFTQMHMEKGVKFHFNTSVQEFKGSGGKLDKVLLKNGEILNADVCVIGIGVNASTGFAKDCGVETTRNGSIVVDKFLKARDDIYVGGDIASFPLKMLGGKHVTIGHWQLSHAHGRAAALNMLGKNQEIDTVPFFWTMQYGKSIRYAGHAAEFDEVIIEGSVEELAFVAYYIKGKDVLAVATVGRDPIAAHAANHLYNGTMPSADEIRTDPARWHRAVSA
ncbi:apoptosis-inducing factor 3-like isoform X2 [Dendronephthya gigantea]|nr:apoptosis-inducing factor 3-like isoform X2 [Dendronephthya gigantea]